MDTVKKVTLIETTLTRRGDGEDMSSPVRIITEWWTLNGNKVAERDPAAVQITPEDEEQLVVKLLPLWKLDQNPDVPEVINAIREFLKSKVNANQVTP